MLQRRRGGIIALALACVAMMVAAASTSARTSARPSWCGPKKITLGLTDGFGGNSWRLVTTASAAVLGAPAGAGAGTAAPWGILAAAPWASRAALASR